MKKINSLLIVISISMLISCETITRGCMDETASNYNENANTDDGSCLYPGCMDADYLNFDPNANVDDDSCEDIAVPGCTDEAYFEYNSNANVDDGSCEFISFDYTPFSNPLGESSSNISYWGWLTAGPYTGWAGSGNSGSCLNDEAGCIYSWGYNSNIPINDVLSKDFIGVPTNSFVSFWYSGGGSLNNIYLTLKVNESIIWDVSDTDYLSQGYGYKNVIVPLNQSGNLTLSFESEIMGTQSIYLDEISILTN